MPSKKYPKEVPEQHQDVQPGRQHKMHPKPISARNYQAANKLKGKVALITGGDSGIGRAIAIMFAMEGAQIAISYLNEQKDAEYTKVRVEQQGKPCLLLPGDIGEESLCKQIVKDTVKEYGKIDILVNNAAEQHPQSSIEKITRKQLEKTFRTNIFSFFYLTKEAMKYMRKGSTIINTTSVTAYRGSEHLIDYSATKGAIVAFTRSLSQSLASKEIRVNAVAPGPIWTPLIPSTFSKEHVAKFGKDQPLGRVGQPEEVAPCYVFLASEDSSYMSGQVLHPNGGEVING